MKCDFLFIYGTLLRALRGNMFSDLEKHLQFVSTGTFQGRMYEIHHYPGVVPSSDKRDIVKGEIYEILNPEYVDDVLDDYEGSGKRFKGDEEYLRRVVPVLTDNNKRVNTWIYLYNRPVNNLTPITGGDYVHFVKDEHLKSWTGMNG